MELFDNPGLQQVRQRKRDCVVADSDTEIPNHLLGNFAIYNFDIFFNEFLFDYGILLHGGSPTVKQGAGFLYHIHPIIENRLVIIGFLFPMQQPLSYRRI